MRSEPKILAARGRHRKGNVCDAQCPSRVVLDHVTSRWGTLILLVLLAGTLRFSELARTIGGVSEKMLAQTLQILEGDGLISRTVFPTIPPKVEYSLTSLGRQAALHLRALTDWVEENVPNVLRHKSSQILAKSGQKK